MTLKNEFETHLAAHKSATVQNWEVFILPEAKEEFGQSMQVEGKNPAIQTLDCIRDFVRSRLELEAFTEAGAHDGTPVLWVNYG